MAANTFLNRSNFEVNIDGISLKNFSAVEGIGVDIEVQSYQEGASKVQQSRKGRTTFPNITLTRRFDGDKTLMSWIQDCVQKAPVKRNGSIILKDDEQNEIVRYNFTEAWPIAYRAPSFNNVKGEDSDVAYEKIILDVETIELA